MTDKPTAHDIDLSRAQWQSPTDDRPGIEVAFLDDGTTLMRNAEDPDGPVLVFTPAEWEAFVGGVKDGEFDLSETHPGRWADEEDGCE